MKVTILLLLLVLSCAMEYTPLNVDEVSEAVLATSDELTVISIFTEKPVGHEYESFYELFRQVDAVPHDYQGIMNLINIDISKDELAPIQDLFGVDVIPSIVVMDAGDLVVIEELDNGSANTISKYLNDPMEMKQIQ